MDKLSVSRPLSLRNIHINDPFWSEYIRLVRDVVVPYQWEALNDRIDGAEPSHAMRNFKIAAGLEQGDFYGMVFQDSDVAKWLEAVSYLLETEEDPELERVADEVVEIIAKAQQADGYLNTYFTLKEPERKWTNLAECHELYCAGHLIEASVAYYHATGKRRILDVACRLADCIDEVFGADDGKLHGYDGHEEIELALVKLYHATGEEKYLKLGQYFLDERGKEPHFYDLEFQKRNGHTHFQALDMVHERSYSQAHLPVREQSSAEGHAVRLVYLCSGMADIAAETGDKELLEACRKLWRNIVTKRMYITGGIGSMAHGESFTLDYDLPNDTSYTETCASIGLIFFAQRMLRIEPISEYADVLELALYNTVISGMSRDGKHFFYVNPLEVWPAAGGKNKNLDHVKPQRQEWFGCACCPPNIARLLASLGQYIYSVKDQTIYTHLYIGGEAVCEVGGQLVTLVQQSEMPWGGAVRFELIMEETMSFALALRIPSWSSSVNLSINGTELAIEETINLGYAHINRHWQSGDLVELHLGMAVNGMTSHPLLRETVGKIAIQRGPIVYCLEEADNGPNLHQIMLELKAAPVVQWEQTPMGSLQTITAPAQRIESSDWGEQLYKPNHSIETRPVEAKFIPYYAWANRGLGEMRVWVNSLLSLEGSEWGQ